MTTAARWVVAALVLALAVAGVIVWHTATVAERFEAERRRMQDTLAVERADNARLATLVTATQTRADSLTRVAQHYAERGDRAVAQATATRRMLVHVEAAYRDSLARVGAPDTATMVPRRWYALAQAEAAAWAVAATRADSGRVVQEAAATVLAQALDEVSATLARRTARLMELERFVAAAEPPCRLIGPVPCPSRLQAAGLAIVGTVLVGEYSDEIGRAIGDAWRRAF